MNFYFWLITNSVMLGVGLAMDAFSVSLANGFAEPHMKKGRMLEIAGIYALFQFAMPVIGWLLVHEAVTFFTGFQKFIPWIALILLAFIGGKMLIEGIKSRKCKNGMDCDNCSNKECDIKEDVQAGELTTKVLMVQGIATSIDALSVGFTIAEYDWKAALVESLLIALTTFGICVCGVLLGRKFGTLLAWRASILGGVILIVIGLEIFLKGIL